MLLGDIINLDVLQKIQDSFAEATGFAAIIVDFKGEPLLKYSGFSKFCQRLRKDPKFNERCMRSDAHGSLESARKVDVCIYRCHAGLVDFAVPIIVEGTYIASMMCGQVLATEYQEINTELMNYKANIFEEDPVLLDLYKQIPTLPFARIKETADLLYTILKYIVDQYLLNQKNIKLLNEQKELMELEKQYRELEIKYYHSQINPHFLFNSLNMAGRLAYMENANKTQEIIYTLADMYRYYLKDTNYLISVEEELKNVKNYMFIQKVRFGDLLNFNLEVTEDILNFRIPAMTLQIFVENSVRHGLEQKEDLGSVQLSGKAVNNTLHFEISDNGIGIPQEKIAILNQIPFTNREIGLGLFNIHKRLNYYFSDKYRIYFAPELDKGTKVILTIPLINEN